VLVSSDNTQISNQTNQQVALSSWCRGVSRVQAQPPAAWATAAPTYAMHVKPPHWQQRYS
jgi:hypothetical protein